MGGRLALLAVLVGLAAVAVLATAPPGARPADAAPHEFSAGRAAAHVAQIAQRPHPVGSAEQAAVRRYIEETARANGAEVRVESDQVIRVPEGSPFPSAAVHNVVATLPGSAPQTSGGRALLVMAHYDSVPVGPGAADNGAAVAAMLETMRALRASGGVRNDVVFLFTDAEEPGLLGAQAFVDRHGVDQVGAVLNWEARGSRGPVWMFETSDGNHPLVRAFAAASPRPLGNSLTYEVYRRLPNDTDFTVFREAGAAGMNAAFLEGFHDYHSTTDTPGRLSADSMQHHGETMLGLARALGDADLRTVRGGDAVYFDVFARVVVHYPASWAVPLALVTVLGLVVLVVFAARRPALRLGGVLVVAGVGFGVALGGAVLAFVLWRLVLVVRPDLVALPLSEPYEQAGFAVGFALVGVAALLLAGRLVRGRRPAERVAGALVLPAVLLLVCVFTAPGASFLFQWPLVAGLLALWWAAWRSSGGGVLVSGLAGAVAVVLFAPLVDNLMVALGIPLAAVAVLIAVLGGVVLLPLLAAMPRVGLLAGGAALGAVAVLGVSVADSGYAPREPRPDALVYVRDAVDGKALWLTGDREPDSWTARALGPDPAATDAVTYLPLFAGRPVLTAPAPMVDLPAPTVELLADTVAGDTRTVRFRVASQRDAWQLQIRLPAPVLRACTIAGRRIEAAVLAEQAEQTGGVVFHHFGEAAVELGCEIEAGARLPVEVSDHEIGLPAAVAQLVGPRPEATVPVSYGLGPVDSTIVRQQVTL